ncbi:MAG TPA: hypothetical protein VK808_11935, partial [Bacteroidia bacterium]|nr:hypothetical protein [Bacteroidia bacterium]
MNILLMDNDVMVLLFGDFYDFHKDSLKKIMLLLQQEYGEIWIPQEIRNEFYLKRNDRKRRKRLDKIKKEYPFIIDCPINVGQHEIRRINGINEKDNGEVDAIIQCIKAKSQANIKFTEIRFLTRDKGATIKAGKLNVDILKYMDL